MNSEQLWLPARDQATQHSTKEMHEPLPLRSICGLDWTRRATAFPHNPNWDHESSSVVEHLPSMYMTEQSIPNTGDKNPSSSY